VQSPGVARNIVTGDSYSADAVCPSGKSALAGGYETAGTAHLLNLVRSTPLTGGTGWNVTLRNNTAGTLPNALVRAWAVCATVTP
jgi:hypothetical protein